MRHSSMNGDGTMTTEKDARLTRMLRAVVWGGAVFAFLVPVVAQLTLAIPWTTFGFVAWAVMLLVAAGVCEIALRLSGRLAYRAGVIVAVGTGFLITWSNLAVGIIGDENNPLNQMYFGVLAVAFAGSLLARLKPGGMAWAMGATAAAQVVVAVIAQAAGHFTWIATAVFCAAWLLSAWLFRKAGRDGPAATA